MSTTFGKPHLAGKQAADYCSAAPKSYVVMLHGLGKDTHLTMVRYMTGQADDKRKKLKIAFGRPSTCVPLS